MGLVCNNDAEIEPNESIADPTLTGIPEVHPSIGFVGLAICPSTDSDVFRLDVDQDQTSVSAQVTFDEAFPAPQLEILSGGGTSIATGTLTRADVLRAAVPNLPMGTYFVQVRGTLGENNYDLQIDTSAP